ncbi:TetR family transcriptional regulator [Streptomyces sp. XM4193]|uniref:TetR/AcrR family transcriptional regulator n=1 Tax=Streptomyces sp. XM4193 TaxID=2929782 RepID=UPI001FF982D1|nr:TetR family transcriptional regulator [Streptomyces sp. XM4193]MCK1797563.1 TetR family transcriptional regulator [Streptomyces sp. XM4193]
MNTDRRTRLGDAAMEVLAEHGGRGLTHRAVDAVADVPAGTAKNYFPTRDALLRAAAEQCVRQYRAITEELAARGPSPDSRRALVAQLTGLLADVAGPGRTRLLACLELQAEAARRPALSDILDPIAASDFPGMEAAQRAAGLPLTPAASRTVTLALHGAITHLLAGGPATIAAAGLDDLDRFVRELLDAVRPE